MGRAGWAEGYKTLGVGVQVTFLGSPCFAEHQAKIAWLIEDRHPFVLCELQKVSGMCGPEQEQRGWGCWGHLLYR